MGYAVAAEFGGEAGFPDGVCRQTSRREPLWTETETLVFEQQERLAIGVHLVGYLLLMGIVSATKWNPQLSAWDFNRMLVRFALPFILLGMVSLFYCLTPLLRHMYRSSPKERDRLEIQINKLAAKLKLRIGYKSSLN